MTFNRESLALTGKRAIAWVGAWETARDAMEAAGFGRIAGGPNGNLYDVPEIADEASRFASKVRQRECARQKCDVPVEYSMHFDGNAIVATAVWATGQE